MFCYSPSIPTCTCTRRQSAADQPLLSCVGLAVLCRPAVGVIPDGVVPSHCAIQPVVHVLALMSCQSQLKVCSVCHF